MRRLTLLLILALLAVPAAAQASSRQVVSFEAPRELFDDGLRDRTLDEIKAFGVDRVRQLVYWKDFAPNPAARTKPRFDATDPDAYPAGTWDRLDKLFASAEARDIAVMLTLTGPVPKWATKGRKDYLTQPSPKEFQRFATAVGRRYGERVEMWSIWNEPNQPQFLLPQYKSGDPVSPRWYRKLYRAAVKGLQVGRANDEDRILIGETSPRGNENVVHPLVFLRGMLCLDEDYKKDSSCGRLDTGGYAHHAYTTRRGPRFVPPDNDVTIGVLSRLVTALNRAADARAIPKNLGVYLTEFGIQSTPDTVSGVSLERQAAYLAISEQIAYANPRVRLFSQYLMHDDAPRSTGGRFSGFESGLRRADGRPKPSYEGFRLPLAAEDYGKDDVLWGLVRPHRAATSVTIEARPRGGEWRRLRTVKTGSTGVWALRTRSREGQRYRVRWTAPDGQGFTGAEVRAF
jgi:Cellulase (glycosyl hydrolase family 5)